MRALLRESGDPILEECMKPRKIAGAFKRLHEVSDFLLLLLLLPLHEYCQYYYYSYSSRSYERFPLSRGARRRHDAAARRDHARGVRARGPRSLLRRG